MSKTIPHKAQGNGVFPLPVVVGSKALSAQTKDVITQEECAALMEELTTAAFAEMLDLEHITHLLGRLTGNHHPPEAIRQCILSRIAFQAALNRSACVETGNLLNGWLRISKHAYGQEVQLTTECIEDAIREGVACRMAYAEEIQKKLAGTTSVHSEKKFKKELQERIYAKYFA